MKYFNNQKLFIILFFLFINYSKEDKLRWAFEIFRHGARTPYSGMTKDFKDCFGFQWNGIKELTGVGLRQHFLVGYRNRIRYIEEKHLIKENYDPREVYLISTDSNRTIMSANAQVQGLYLPGTGPVLYENQTKIAVPPIEAGSYEEEKQKLDNDNFTALPNRMNIMPIHSFFNEEHFIQLQDKKVCPKTNEIYLKNQQRKEVVDFLNDMTEKYGKKLMNILTEKDENILKNYTKAYYIFDTIITQYTEGVDFFQNILNTLNVSQKELLDDSFKFFDLDLVGNGIDNDKELCLHSMSPIFDRLIKWMDAKIEKDKEGLEDYTEYDLPKFVMFSAHDSTCAAFMGFMKEVFGTEIRYPYFATNINLELNRIEKQEGNINEDDYKIDYIINDESMLNISYKEFVQKINEKKKSTEDINKFCGFDEQKKDDKKEEEKNDDKKDENKGEQEEGSSNVYIIVNVILSIISIILIVLIILTIKKKKSKADSNMEDINKIEALTNMNEGAL